MNITGYPRKILEYLNKQHGENGNIYGNISYHVGLSSWEKAKEYCEILFENGLAEWRDESVIITQSGKNWVTEYKQTQLNRIEEFVHEDYNFALLRFLYDQDLPMAFDDFPIILQNEAPKKTSGYSSAQLHHILNIEFGKYIQSKGTRYELKPEGRNYTEYLAKKKNIDLTEKINEAKKEKAVRIFISYAHADSQWLTKVQLHLRALKNHGKIEIEGWDDTKLIAGDRWEFMIGNELERADVAILLISTPFLASDFIAHKELVPLLDKAENKGTLIIPVIIGNSLFSQTNLAKFQAVNNPSQPLSALTNEEQDVILVKMCNDINTQLLRRFRTT